MPLASACSMYPPDVFVEQEPLAAETPRGVRHLTYLRWVGYRSRLTTADRQPPTALRLAKGDLLAGRVAPESSPPNAGARRPQPVSVASSTATSGSRTPAMSFPSASVFGTKAGYGEPAKPVGGIGQDAIVKQGPVVEQIAGGHEPGVGRTGDVGETDTVIPMMMTTITIVTMPAIVVRLSLWQRGDERTVVRGAARGSPAVSAATPARRAPPAAPAIRDWPPAGSWAAGGCRARSARSPALCGRLEQVEPDVPRIPEIVPARVGVQERSGLHPILVRRVRLEDLGTGVTGPAPAEARPVFPVIGSNRTWFANGNCTFRIPAPDVLAVGTAGLGEAIVEEASAAPADPVEHPVENALAPSASLKPIFRKSCRKRQGCEKQKE